MTIVNVLLPFLRVFLNLLLTLSISRDLTESAGHLFFEAKMPVALRGKRPCAGLYTP